MKETMPGFGGKDGLAGILRHDSFLDGLNYAGAGRNPRGAKAEHKGLHKRRTGKSAKGKQ